VKHRAHGDYWDALHSLPFDIQQLAKKSFELMKADPRHPSIRLKKVGQYWSARVGLHYRAVAIEVDGDLLWVWIGPHGEYDRFIKG
jgi:hypothetical protein